MPKAENSKEAKKNNENEPTKSSISSLNGKYSGLNGYRTPAKLPNAGKNSAPPRLCGQSAGIGFADCIQIDCSMPKAENSKEAEKK